VLSGSCALSLVPRDCRSRKKSPDASAERASGVSQKTNGFCPGKLDMSEAKMRVIETIKTLGL